MKICKMKLLREKYGLTLRELAQACGLSQQRLCEIETSGKRVLPETLNKVQAAFWEVQRTRQADNEELCRDLRKHESSLLEYVEENGYEF